MKLKTQNKSSFKIENDIKNAPVKNPPGKYGGRWAGQNTSMK